MPTQEFNNYTVKCTTNKGMRSGVPYSGTGTIHIKADGNFDFKESDPQKKYKPNKVICELDGDNIRFEKRTNLFKVIMRLSAEEFESSQKSVNRFKKLHASKVK